MFDLDFKEAHYGNTDGEKKKLAGYVAAIANTAGGVIFIGIEEDDQARAIAAPGVQVSEAERGRIRQIVASQVSPCPTFDVEIITDECECPAATSQDASGHDEPQATPLPRIHHDRRPAQPERTSRRAGG